MSVSHYSKAEELLHALSHGLGALLGITALIVMLTVSLPLQDGWYIASSIIYGSSSIPKCRLPCFNSIVIPQSA